MTLLISKNFGRSKFIHFTPRSRLFTWYFHYYFEVLSAVLRRYILYLQWHITISLLLGDPFKCYWGGLNQSSSNMMPVIIPGAALDLILKAKTYTKRHKQTRIQNKNINNTKIQITHNSYNIVLPVIFVFHNFGNYP